MIRRRGLIGVSSRPQGALYWLGDECTSLTGGWNEQYPIYNISYWQSSNRKGTATKNEDNLFLTAYNPDYSGNIKSIAFETFSKIDVTNFSTLKINIKNITLIGEYSRLDFGLISDRTCDSKEISILPNGLKKTIALAEATTGEVVLDISQLSGEYYAFWAVQRQSEGEASAYIDKIWLE